MKNLIQIGLQDTIEYSYFCGETPEDVRNNHAERVYNEGLSPTREKHFAPRYLMEAIDYEPMRVIGVEILPESAEYCKETYSHIPNLHVWNLGVSAKPKKETELTLQDLCDRVTKTFGGDVWGIVMSINGGELDVLKTLVEKPVYLEVRSPDLDDGNALLKHILSKGYRIYEKVVGNVTQIRADRSTAEIWSK